MNARYSIFNWCESALRDGAKKITDVHNNHLWECWSPFSLPSREIRILRKAAVMVQSDPEFDVPLKKIPRISTNEIRRWKFEDILAFRREIGVALPVELDKNDLLTDSLLSRSARCAASGISPGAFVCSQSDFAPYEAASLGTWNGISPIIDIDENIINKIKNQRAKFIFLSPECLVDTDRRLNLLNFLNHSRDVHITIGGLEGKSIDCGTFLPLVYTIPDQKLIEMIATPRFSSISNLFYLAYDIKLLVEWQKEDKDIYFVIAGHLKWFDYYAFRNILNPLRVIGTIGYGLGIRGVAHWTNCLKNLFGVKHMRYIILETCEALYFRHRFPEFYSEKDYDRFGTCIAAPVILVTEKHLSPKKIEKAKEILNYCAFPTSSEEIRASRIASQLRHTPNQRSCYWIEVGYKLSIYSNNRSEEFRAHRHASKKAKKEILPSILPKQYTQINFIG